MCRMENKIVKVIDCPFYYSDLSQIDQSYCSSYEGQTKNNCIRHGYGTQTYVNGEKYMGTFS